MRPDEVVEKSMRPRTPAVSGRTLQFPRARASRLGGDHPRGQSRQSCLVIAEQTLTYHVVGVGWHRLEPDALQRSPMPDEILTIKELARLLKLAEKTVYAMANADEIPAFKVRGQWRVKRVDIERWMAQQLARRSKS